jgi:hypothetical protein
MIIKTIIFFLVVQTNAFTNVQTNLYYEVNFGTKKKWPFKTGDLLKEVKFIYLYEIFYESTRKG